MEVPDAEPSVWLAADFGQLAGGGSRPGADVHLGPPAHVWPVPGSAVLRSGGRPWLVLSQEGVNAKIWLMR